MKHHLTYQDATSNKFWNIEVSGKSFTVTYGKIGTSGQTQTKTFDDDEKCLKEANKLLSEKLKKGYQNSGEGEIVVAVASPKSAGNKPVKSKTEISETKTESKSGTANQSAANEVPETHSKNGIHKIEAKKLKEPIEKTLGLSKEDLAIRSNVVPVRPKEEPKTFDLKARIEQLSSLKRGNYGRDIDWTNQDIPLFMSKPEAHFWFLVLSRMEALDDYDYEGKKNKRNIQKFQEFLGSQTIDGNLTL
ncbi:WGR domain protein [Leptospira weilii serovar Ranarum str. ICFT]|uniref:WGR domain protein n=1 Tax=Leptospira weilii serovar Ranarum str. ICFT TaxID=1218598 RepID=N1WU56_9LEPT|nr:WGR domain protein [Leptospira weilii serovar Ranarum str. ICFT]